MSRLFAVIALLLAVAQPLTAQGSRVEPLFRAIGLADLIQVMHEEGVGYGAELEAGLFPGRGGEAWARQVAAIYAPERMERHVGGALEARLDDAEIAAATAFFASPAGQRIIELELAARRSLLDAAVEEAARDGWMALQEGGGRRWDLLAQFVEVNDLIESNVAGAMTSNFAFFRAMVDGKAFEGPTTDNEILADIWGQEAKIREQTTDWVFSFVTLAYQPLSDEDLRAYIAFSETAEGQALNAALFESFNDLFAEISGEMGLTAAGHMAGEDI